MRVVEPWTITSRSGQRRKKEMRTNCRLKMVQSFLPFASSFIFVHVFFSIFIGTSIIFPSKSLNALKWTLPGYYQPFSLYIILRLVRFKGFLENIENCLLRIIYSVFQGISCEIGIQTAQIIVSGILFLTCSVVILHEFSTWYYAQYFSFAVKVLLGRLYMSSRDREEVTVGKRILIILISLTDYRYFEKVNKNLMHIHIFLAPLFPWHYRNT